jgi:hypothetical protein
MEDKIKVLVVPDIHGKYEELEAAFEKYFTENYDKIILLGDLADSFDRTDEDILNCFYIAKSFKETLKDKMIWLIGNHETSYVYNIPCCSGFRQTLNNILHPFLKKNKDLFQIAYQYKNYLFTHAGVQKKWWNKYKDVLDTFEGTTADKLNQCYQTHHRDILYEVGVRRGGMRNSYGGPLWCDRTEMQSYGPIPDYIQVVGHTPCKSIEKIEKFEGDKYYDNTAVIFCDVLDRLPNTFLTLEI